MLHLMEWNDGQLSKVDIATKNVNSLISNRRLTFQGMGTNAPSSGLKPADISQQTKRWSCVKPNIIHLCTVLRDQAYAVLEWIQYHRRVGVSHFYIYDNNSQDNLQEVLKPFVEEGVVTVISWRDQPPVDAKTKKKMLKDHSRFFAVQENSYTHCLHRATSKWAALIDIDEFITPKDGRCVTDILPAYEKFAGIGLNWRFYGVDGTVLISDATKMTAFERADFSQGAMISGSKHIKTIVHLGKIPNAGRKMFNWMPNPHFVRYFKGFFTVDIRGARVDGPWSQPPANASCESQPWDVMQLSHFKAGRSFEEFLYRRVFRGRANKNPDIRTNKHKPFHVEDVYEEQMDLNKLYQWNQRKTLPILRGSPKFEQSMKEIAADVRASLPGVFSPDDMGDERQTYNGVRGGKSAHAGGL
jgi:hypothetical protein